MIFYVRLANEIWVKMITGYSGLSPIWLHCGFSPLSKHTFFSCSIDTHSDHVWLCSIFGCSPKGIIRELPFSSLNCYFICLQLEYYYFPHAFTSEAINSHLPQAEVITACWNKIFPLFLHRTNKKTFMNCLIYAWHYAKCYRYRNE